MGLFRRTKNNNRPLLSQIIALIPGRILQKSIQQHKSDKYCSRYKTYDQLVSLMFGQLNKCYTLEDISAGIGVSGTFIKDLGLHQSPARSTMSDGNKKRNWQVFESLYYSLLRHYEGILIKRHHSRVIEEIKTKTIKIIDSTTISLCLSLFNWAKFRTAKGGIKIHTCWDDTLMIPDMINITEAKLHDSKGMHRRLFDKGTIIVEDKGYFDFELMKLRIDNDNEFVTRIKDNTSYEVIKERDLPDDTDQHILCDEEIMLTGTAAAKAGIEAYALRRIAVYDEEHNRTIELITSNMDWAANTISQLYKKRWQIELFFKALKQNLQVKTFTGTSPNAVKSQIYVALICYLLLELIRRNTCKAAHAFSNFTEKIRICLCYYLSLDYVCNEICQGAKIVIAEKPPDLFSSHLKHPSSKINTFNQLFE
ncbi:MAG: IS4 family transposase [Chitinophagaceae bacterium]